MDINFKNFRDTIGVSQVDVASDLGLEQSSISRFEKGQAGSMKILRWYIDHGLLEYLAERRLLNGEENITSAKGVKY